MLSPAFEGGIGETRFYAKAVETGLSATLLLQTTLDGGSNWTTQASFNVTTANTFSAWLYLIDLGAQARLISTGSGDALVDNVEFRIPVLYRNQNFDGWPTRSSYVSETVQGWTISNSVVDTQYAMEGQVARLNTAVGNYIRSPEIPDGLGTISFWTRKWGAGDTAFTLQVQVSPNGSSWTTLASVSASSTNYQPFTYFLEDATNRYLRLYHSAGSVRVLVDDIRIGAIQPRPEVIIVPALDPATPLIDDPMTINAAVVSRYGASILTVTGYYRIATGSTNALNMTADAPGAYSTVSDIPGQAAGTMIRYYVTVRYAGVGAAPASTGYTTNSATTAVFTNFVSTIPPGTVWINELFYAPYGTDEPYYIDTNTWEVIFTGSNHEFLELCGREGADISGWKLEFGFGNNDDIAANSNRIVYASYTIPTNTVFTNQTNGFSFYVLGDTELFPGEPVDQFLTTPIPTNATYQIAVYLKDHIYDGLGVVNLLDQFGNLVYSFSYNGYAFGADRIPQSQDFVLETNSISLTGSNYTYSGFSWDKTNITIGAINDGQTLTDPPATTNDYGYGWHTQGLEITPANTNLVLPFFMLDPDAPLHLDTIDIYYGYTNAAYDNPAGTLYHRPGSGGWSQTNMIVQIGSLDAGGHAYVYGRLPDHTYRRLQTLQYVLQVTPNETGILDVYLGSDAGDNNLSTVYTNLADAQVHPFSYLIPIGDVIYITNLVVGTTNVFLQTDGNDPVDPLTNYYIQFTTNALTQYRYVYDLTNTNYPIIGLDTNSTWGTWVNTNFTSTRDAYSNYSFNVKKPATNWPKAFFRIVPRWP